MTNPLHIHIVSFDIPDPPSYGGAIDVYYKVRPLHEAHVHVPLHCFYRGTLHPSSTLEQWCDRVFYYRCSVNPAFLFAPLPFAVMIRRSDELLDNLLKDNHPILFEGLVSCYLLTHPQLRDRVKFYRECNIEHHYYHALGQSMRSPLKRWYYFLEARKLKQFEPCIRNATYILAVAHQDEAHFKQHYPSVPTSYIPSFHADTEISVCQGQGDYILYHGNLAVAENDHAARHIVKHIAPMLPDIPFVIAGRNPSKQLYALASQYANVQIIASPSTERMEQLIRDAQIHLLITFQGTGLKLKLLNVLYHGRHIIANPQMVVGTELAQLCVIGRTDDELIQLCKSYFGVPCERESIAKREKLLHQLFNNQTLCETLLHTLTATK